MTLSTLEISAAPTRQLDRGNVRAKLSRVPWVRVLFLFVAFESGLFVYSFISVENATRLAPWISSRDESTVDRSPAHSPGTGQPRGLSSTRGSFRSECESMPLAAASIQCSASGVCSGAALPGVTRPCPSGAPAVGSVRP